MRMLAMACVVTGLLGATSASAADWSAKANLIDGKCSSGAIATVSEQPGSMRVTISSNGKTVGGGEVKLAADGSGSTQMQGAAGIIYLTVPAGTGKRTFKTKLIDGSCEWAWN